MKKNFHSGREASGGLQFLVLLLLIIAGYERIPPTGVDAPMSGAMTLGGIVLVGLAAELPAALLTRRIWYHRGARLRQVRLYQRCKLYHVLFAVVVFLGTLY